MLHFLAPKTGLRVGGAQFSGAAANLASASITTTVKVNGTACTTDSGCSTLLVAGATALVKTTYPCDLKVMGVNYKPNCILSAQSAQMVQ